MSSSAGGAHRGRPSQEGANAADADMLMLSSTDEEGGRVQEGEDLELEEGAIDELHAQRESRSALNAVADWSQPGGSAGRSGRPEEIPASAAGGRGAGGGEDDTVMEGGLDLFVIDNNPDMSLLRAASPDSGAAPAGASTEDTNRDVGTHDTATTSASAPTTAAGATSTSSGAAAGASASIEANAATDPTANIQQLENAPSTSAQTQHLAGPGEHVLTNGLLLPSNIILDGEDLQSMGAHLQNGAGGGEEGDGQDLGEYEQLDASRTATRYYEEEKEEQRKAKETCHKCGEQGHIGRKCPHIKCLKCGAIDEHSTGSCPLALQCFRCGQVGHMSRDCKNKAAPGSSSRECERCGSQSHRAATCPTLWRIYVYNSAAEYAEARQKKHDALQRELVETGGDFNNHQGSSSGGGKKGKDKEGRKGKEADKDIDLGKPRRDWDPATRWCYNCGMKGNHWGDDCPNQRSGSNHYSSFNRNNNTRTLEPGIFSERISRLGPFAHELDRAPPLAGPGGLPSSTFDFEIGDGARMHLSADPYSMRADRAAASYGYGSSSRRGDDLLDRFDRRSGGRDHDRDRGRDRYDDRERERARDRERDKYGRRRWDDEVARGLRADGPTNWRGSGRQFEGRASGHAGADNGDEEDPDDWFAKRGERPSKRSKQADGSSSTNTLSSQRRRDREDDEEGGRSSRSKRSRDGSSLLDRLAGSDNKSSSSRRGGSGGRNGGGYRDDDEDMDVEEVSGSNRQEKGKGRQPGNGDPLSPSRTLGASGVISLLSEDEDEDGDEDYRPNRRSRGRGRQFKDDDDLSPMEDQSFEVDQDEDDDEIEFDASRSSIRTSGSYTSIGRNHLGGPAYGPNSGGAVNSYPPQEVKFNLQTGGHSIMGASREGGGGGGGGSGRGVGARGNAGGFVSVGGQPVKLPKRKRNKGGGGGGHLERGEGSVAGSASGSGGGRRKKKYRQGSAAPSSSGSGVKIEGDHKPGKGKKNGGKKKKGGGGGGGNGGVKREGSAGLPPVKREFQPQFRGGY
ncbi:hypothetical protein CF327_g5854 [Tilletia walkeri]|nr:hypothetical protein CF327_g5854 [Tilletia walkeri]